MGQDIIVNACASGTTRQSDGTCADNQSRICSILESGNIGIGIAADYYYGVGVSGSVGLHSDEESMYLETAVGAGFGYGVSAGRYYHAGAGKRQEDPVEISINAGLQYGYAGAELNIGTIKEGEIKMNLNLSGGGPFLDEFKQRTRVVIGRGAWINLKATAHIPIPSPIGKIINFACQ